MASATDQRIIKLVQELLLDEEDKAAVTPALIGEKIDLVLAMNPKWRDGLDRQAVTDELIRRFSLWIGQDATPEQRRPQGLAECGAQAGLALLAALS